MRSNQHLSEPTTELETIRDTENCQIIDYRDCLATFSGFNSFTFFVIDYQKKTFDFISDNPIFLCGYSIDEIKRLGLEYFEKVIPADDFNMIVEVHKKWIGFLHTLPVEKRKYCNISCDVRMKQHNGNCILVNQSFKSMRFDNDDDIWLAAGQVKLSNNKQPGNVAITMEDEHIKYTYSVGRKAFIRVNSEPPTPREKQIISLIVSGCTVREMARKLYIDCNTVKFHKKNIFKKLGVKNVAQVIVFALTEMNMAS